MSRKKKLETTNSYVIRYPHQYSLEVEEKIEEKKRCWC
jgi:hypothetical protein